MAGAFVVDLSGKFGQAAIDEHRTEFAIQNQNTGLEIFQNLHQIGARLLAFAQAGFKLFVLSLKLPFKIVGPPFQAAKLLNEFEAVMVKTTDEPLQRLNVLLRLAE